MIQPAFRPGGGLIFNSSFQCSGCLQTIAVFLRMWSLSPSALKWAPCPYSSVYFCLVGVTSFTACRYAYKAFYFWKLLACNNYTQRSHGLANSTVLSCHKVKLGRSKSASKACQGSGNSRIYIPVDSKGLRHCSCPAAGWTVRHQLSFDPYRTCVLSGEGACLAKRQLFPFLRD